MSNTNPPQEGTVHLHIHPQCELQKSYFAYLHSVWSVCGVMHLITTSEVGSVDERIHTLADSRMVISLMNEAFDQVSNGVQCRLLCVCIDCVPFFRDL